jgi:hypothetical protein
VVSPAGAAGSSSFSAGRSSQSARCWSSGPGSRCPVPARHRQHGDGGCRARRRLPRRLMSPPAPALPAVTARGRGAELRQVLLTRASRTLPRGIRREVATICRRLAYGLQQSVRVVRPRSRSASIRNGGRDGQVVLRRLRGDRPSAYDVLGSVGSVSTCPAVSARRGGTQPPGPGAGARAAYHVAGAGRVGTVGGISAELSIRPSFAQRAITGARQRSLLPRVSTVPTTGRTSSSGLLVGRAARSAVLFGHLSPAGRSSCRPPIAARARAPPATPRARAARSSGAGTSPDSPAPSSTAATCGWTFRRSPAPPGSTDTGPASSGAGRGGECDEQRAVLHEDSCLGQLPQGRFSAFE